MKLYYIISRLDKLILSNFQGRTLGKAKVISAKVTGRGEPRPGVVQASGSTLAPPMSSVIVERHQPVTKVSEHNIVIIIMGSISRQPAFQNGHPMFYKIVAVVKG